MRRDHSVWHSLKRNADLFGERTAFAFDDAELTHRQVVDLGRRYAGHLAGLGVSRGDRIAVLSDGRPEFFGLLAAAACLGSILVPINWRLSTKEIGQVLDDCTPTALFVQPRYQPLVADRGERLIVLPEDKRSAGSFAAQFEAEQLEPDLDARCDLPLLILYTAAYDGSQRGAVISQGNLMASSIQMHLALSFDENDAFLGNLPYFHMMAIALSFGVNFAGGKVVVRPRFEAAEAAGLIESERVTLVGTFPPMLSGLLDEHTAGVRDFRSLRFCMGLDAGPVIERFESQCPDATFWSIYGQTETTGNVTYGRWRDRPGAAGRAAALTQVAIFDHADRIVGEGGVGEIAVRGPGVFRGYWNRDEENAVVMRDGWHHTGDMGRIDAGWLTYQGRAPHKQLIKTGGENVYPVEIERALTDHPAVTRAAVFGVPDERWGEAVVAVCERTPGSVVEADELIAFVGERLARYKKPKRIDLVEQLPTLPHGGPDLDALKKAYPSTGQAAT